MLLPFCKLLTPAKVAKLSWSCATVAGRVRQLLQQFQLFFRYDFLPCS